MAETRVTEGHDELARVLMHQDTFAVFDRAGAISSAARQEQGLYHRGTRHVSRLDLRIDGQRPMTLSSTVVRDNTLLAVDLTNPDLSRDGKVGLPHGSVHLFRGCILEDGVCHQRLRVHNFSVGEVSLDLHLRLEGDFADVFEVRGTRRSRRGKHDPPETHPDGIALAYHGLDGVVRRTRLRCHPAPSQVTESEVRFGLTLAAGEEQELSFEVSCTQGTVHRSGALVRGRGPPEGGGAGDAETPRGAHRLVQRTLRRVAGSLDVRPADAAHPETEWAVPVRRRALVQHALRPRRDHHRAADALDPARGGGGGAPLPRRDPVQALVGRGGRRAREDRPRDPRG